MSKDLFDRLVKIGNNNPDLRDDIAPVLHHSNSDKSSVVSDIPFSIDAEELVRGIRYYAEENGYEIQKGILNLSKGGSRKEVI